jgi:hypothetical protein
MMRAFGARACICRSRSGQAADLFRRGARTEAPVCRSSREIIGEPRLEGPRRQWKGGDNPAASFSPELADASIYVIDVSGGDKIPRKAVPASRDRICSSSTNRSAPDVGASLEVMARDSKTMRGDKRSCSRI